jgi:metal-sulfur cluster biosynthetic enzyme
MNLANPIPGEDGEEPVPTPIPVHGTVSAPAGEPQAPSAADMILGRPTSESVREALRPVHDPELMISIVDLGLIYGVEVAPDSGKVEVKMSLTSPGCPIGPELMAAVEHTARLVPGVEDVHVSLVWDPPWDPTKMASEEAKEQLGIW